MKKISKIFAIAILSSSLLLTAPAIAQDAERNVTTVDTRDDDNDDHGNWGLAGLLGLLGLFGLKRDDDRRHTVRHDIDRDTTTHRTT
jgi:hypothetical protein